MTKYILNLLLLLQATCLFAQQPGKVAKKFFPDPLVEIPTPWFQKGSKPTTYGEMMDFIERTITPYPATASLSYIGETQKGTLIPAVRIVKDTRIPKVKVLFLGRVHGDEPASTEGNLYLMERLLNDPTLAYLLERLDITFIPMGNIDGGSRLNRATANSLDLNRDQSKLITPEGMALRNFYNEYAPEVVIDFHEFQAVRADFAYISSDNITNSYDAMFLYSGNLNVPQELRDLTGNLFVGNAKAAMDKEQLRHHDYFTTSRRYGEVIFNVGGINPRSTANAFSLSNSVAILMEIRGVRLGKQSLKRRVFTIYTLGESFLKTAYEHADEVLRTTSQLPSPADDIVVTSRPKSVEDYPIPFISMNTNKMVEVKVNASLSLESTPVLTRKRPDAYIIPATQPEIVRKLRELGIEVKQLDGQQTLEVEAYRVTSRQQEYASFEKFYPVRVKAEVNTQQVLFPAGTYIVPMQQKNGNLAAAMLEPEAANGFINYRIYDVEEGEELPVYRKIR